MKTGTPNLFAVCFRQGNGQHRYLTSPSRDIWQGGYNEAAKFATREEAQSWIASHPTSCCAGKSAWLGNCGAAFVTDKEEDSQ